MLRYLLRRAIYSVGLGVGIAVLSFLVLYARPDEAIHVLLDENQLRTEAELRSLYGLDRSLPQQLGRWLAGVARGDLGHAWSRGGREVTGGVTQPTAASGAADGQLRAVQSQGVPSHGHQAPRNAAGANPD